VSTPGQQIAGDISLPLPASFDASAPTRGFSATAEQVWLAARVLLSSAAESWGGPVGVAIAAILGCANTGALKRLV
jgi:hypothetical protein